MKRILLPLLFGLVLAVGVVAFWPRLMPAPGPAPGVAVANQDARALTGAEQAAFLPLACAGAGAGSAGYAHSCASLPGYPGSDYGGAGLGLGLTFTSVAYGQFSAPDQAYVSYQGSFEPHADNFGGGILFTRQAGGWALSAWYPGGALDGCLALSSSGRSKMLCLRGFTGQGEADSVLGIATPGEQGFTKILAASDLRGTMDPEANCGLRNAADQNVLLSIDSLARNGSGFTAAIHYVPASLAQTACAAKNFASAKVSTGTLTLDASGTITSPLTFAPAA